LRSKYDGEVASVKLENIVAGVDGSRQSVEAASFACRLAEAVGAKCTIIHATPGLQAPSELLGIASGEQTPTQHLRNQARRKIRSRLRKAVPPNVLDRLEVEVGRAPRVLAEAAQRRAADLVVVGAKRRARLVRPLVGSVVPYLLRAVDVPVLLATPSEGIPRRIVVAVDLSDATEPTLAYAMEFGGRLKGDVRAIHVVEPEVLPPALPVRIDLEQYYRRSKDAFAERLKTVSADRSLNHVVRRGKAAEEIAEEAADWSADLVVVGSHGKGLVDRLLLGSTAMRLAHLLPASILVIPVAQLLRR
jgi:nucleotide-binding universal stress UspA family protein